MKYYEVKDFKWNPRVNPAKIKRLYLQNAKGIIDEGLIDEIGIGFLVRIESIQRVTERACPDCGGELNGIYSSRIRQRKISCPNCNWHSSWDKYHTSYKKHRLHGGRAYPYFLSFISKYQKCKTPGEKMLAIDWLIHILHEDASEKFASPAAQNLIEGKRGEIISLLEELAYNDNMPDSNRKQRKDLFNKLERAKKIQNEDL